jgi:tetratricopeptide (TPR) repeat protein
MRILAVTCLLMCSLTFIATAQDNQLELANQYFSNGEFDKAAELYEKISRRPDNIQKVHKNYLESMFRLEDFRSADRYLKRLLKSYPNDPEYHVDYGRLLKERGEGLKTLEYFDEQISRLKKDNQGLAALATQFIKHSFFEFAEKAYQTGQKNERNAFQYELADLYAIWVKNDQMINQYLDMLGHDENQLDYIQSLLQDRISDEENFDKLENVLIEYVQRNPDKAAYTELLIWYYLQKNEFYKAFVQARAIDRRKKLEGFKILEIGRMALNNNAYRDAIRIFEFLIEKYNDKPVYSISKRLLIKSKEELVKNTYPVDHDKIKSLAKDYEDIIQELGVRRNTAEAVKSLALLHAFYLSNKDTAIAMLQELIRVPNLQPSLISEAKLDLGDIYLLKNEPWEATLLYSQVEKTEKDKNIGHQAKLKNAKLSYYKGDFELARAHLDILKLATSREIANDAMYLSLLIQDNLELDTTEEAMKQYAAIELLVFQSKYEEALKHYDQMLRKFSSHSLSDEILWEKSKILIKMGRFDQAVKALTQIVEEFGYDILADDANFMLGRVHEENLKDPIKAMEYYKKQMIDFPGSIYTVEARKRFRKLRGDNVN